MARTPAFSLKICRMIAGSKTGAAADAAPCMKRSVIKAQILGEWAQATDVLAKTTSEDTTRVRGLRRSAKARRARASWLNPEEQCNATVKRAMENALPGSVADLHRLVRREFSRLQRRPEMIVSFFRRAGLSIAGLL
jgi:hypothetical protein